MTFSQKIVRWYNKHGRHDLPWQSNPTSYRVWVSEIMLQQTQVTTVIDYYQKFMRRFPDLSSLANASLDEVMQLWSGLGYYARAKNLHKAAQMIHVEYKGKFPKSFEKVIALPGIGRSTAGAILSLSTKQRYPILDGNVKRVLARHFAIKGAPNDPKVLENLWALSEKVTPFTEVKEYTQAMMDLGATICTRSNPNCKTCPITTSCKAKKLNQIKHFPSKISRKEKTTKATTLLLLVDLKNQRILLEKRKTSGIWGGLWSFPECPVETNLTNWCQETLQLSIKAFPWEPLQHTFTHFHLNIHPVLCHVKSPATISLNDTPLVWHSLHEAKLLGLPAPIKRLLQELDRRLLCPA